MNIFHFQKKSKIEVIGSNEDVGYSADCIDNDKQHTKCDTIRPGELGTEEAVFNFYKLKPSNNLNNPNT